MLLLMGTSLLTLPFYLPNSLVLFSCRLVVYPPFKLNGLRTTSPPSNDQPLPSLLWMRRKYSHKCHRVYFAVINCTIAAIACRGKKGNFLRVDFLCTSVTQELLSTKKLFTDIKFIVIHSKFVFPIKVYIGFERGKIEKYTSVTAQRRSPLICHSIAVCIN